MNFSQLWLLPNDPKKILSMSIFIVTLVLFSAELISALKSDKDIILTNPLSITKPEQVVLDKHSELFKIPLFGVYVPNVSEASIKQSMLDAEVVGILYSPNEEDSQVLIRVEGGDEIGYGVGEELPGGAVIKKITQDKILVLYNGSLESLSLPKNELLFVEPAKPLIGE